MANADTDHDDFTDQLADHVRQARQRQRTYEPPPAAPVEELDEGILGEAEFRARVAEEIKRSDRYDHTFTVLLIRPDAPVEGAQSLLREKLVGLIEPSLVRGCDVVAMLETEGAMAVLLPETGVAEAGALVERLRPALTGLDSCGFSLLEYPTNKHDMESLRPRAA